MCYSCLYVEHHLWLESSEAHGEFPSEKHYWTLFISWTEQSELNPVLKLETKTCLSDVISLVLVRLYSETDSFD